MKNAGRLFGRRLWLCQAKMLLYRLLGQRGKRYIIENRFDRFPGFGPILVHGARCLCPAAGQTHDALSKNIFTVDRPDDIHGRDLCIRPGQGYTTPRPSEGDHKILALQVLENFGQEVE